MTDSINKFLNINNFQRAWEKVSENRGSAGIDNQTIAEFAQNPILNLTILLDKVANNTYQPHPYKQILIPKTKGKWRELKIPTVQDRVVQQALLNVISPILEPQFSPSSFAYRPNISYINAVEQVAYLRDLGYQWLLDADIVQYFDHIDHSRLLREVRKSLDNPRILCLIKSWLTVGVYTESGTLTYPEKGIPQGSVISPLLANVYLNEFDHLIANSDLKLIRYADDFLIFATTQTRIIQAYSQIGQFLQSIGLNFHAEKTQITNFKRGFRFLGHGFLDQAIFPLESSKKRVKTAEKSQKSTSKKKA
jgi:RNA-directed DNA polymerase